jgi:hypothetical protein
MPESSPQPEALRTIRSVSSQEPYPPVFRWEPAAPSRVSRAPAEPLALRWKFTDSEGRKVSSPFVLIIAAPPLSITNSSPLNGGAAGSPVSQQFFASGGVPPYVFTAAGSLPPGLTLSPGGALSGVASTSGTFDFIVSVRDAENNVATKSFTMVIGVEALRITTSSPLPNGQMEQPYSASISAAGGTKPYRWTLTGVPGLSINSEGAITGVPAEAGSFSVSIGVNDAAGASASRVFELTVAAPPLRVIPDALPVFTAGVDVTGSFAATGGVKPYTWSATGLPSGMSLSADGVFSGKPATPGSYAITATVTDRTGSTASHLFAGTVSPAGLSISASSPFGTLVGAVYSATFTASGGVPPYTWSASGLPPGFSLSQAGVLTGTPVEPGNVEFLVTVVDAVGTRAAQSVGAAFLLPPPPPVFITGAPEISGPATQPRVQVGLNAPYPVELMATMTLTFAPDSGPDDPAVQLSTGGRTARIMIPAGGTVGSSDIGVQTGTVAGVITITVQLLADQENVTPTPIPTRTIRINPAAPSLTGVQARRTGAGLEVTTTGYSTTREMRQAIFRFTAAPGANLQSSELTIPVDATFSRWYQDPASAAFGSQFSFTQTFTIAGDSAGIASVTVMLSNLAGQSAAVTAAVQ